jgi:hypothetical protein
MSNGHEIIKVKDITNRIIQLRQDIEKEKNTKEKARLVDEQAALLMVRRLMPTYRGLIETPNRRIRAH